MKQVVILRGPSGAGKSTFIKKDSEGKPHVVVSADFFFMRDGIYVFDVAKLPEAHSWCFTSFLAAIQKQHELIYVDNTNTRRWEYQNYEFAARMLGYSVRIVELVPQTVQGIKRCFSRNQHGVPMEVIAGQALRFEPNVNAEVFDEEGEKVSTGFPKV